MHMDGWGEVAAALSPEPAENTSEGDLGSPGWGTVLAPRVALTESTAEASLNVSSLVLGGANLKKKRGRPAKKVGEVLAAFFPSVTVPESGSASSAFVGGLGAARTRQGALESVSLHVGQKQCCVPPPKRGRMMMPSSLMPVVLSVQQKAMEVAEEELDTLVMEMGKFYFDPDVYHVCSGKLLEHLFSARHESIQLRMNRLSCSLFLQQQFQRMQLEKTLSMTFGQQSLVMYLDLASYDETPMKLRVQDTTKRFHAHGDPLLAQVGVPEGNHVVETSAGQTVIAKVLQSHSTAVYVLRSGETMFAIALSCFHPLQSLSKTTAAVVCNALCRHSGVSMFAESFPMKVRTVAADNAPSNVAAERMLRDLRGGKWMSAFVGCDIHTLASIHSKTFEALLPDTVCGLIHVGLALRLNHSWNMFKDAICEELAERKLEIIEASIPEKYINYKLALLQVMHSCTATHLQECVQLMTTFNGNWQSNTLVHYWDSNLEDAPSKRFVLDKMQSVAISVLCGTKVHLWPRHRWTGFKESIRDVGLLWACHGLLQGSFKRLLLKLGDRLAKPVSEKQNVGSSTSYENMLSTESALAEDVDRAAGNEMLLTVVASKKDSDIAADTAGVDTESFAGVNARDRRLAAQWLDSNPWSNLLLVALCLRPLDALMRQHFLLSSAAWEKQQRVAVNKAILDGKQAKRSYRIAIAASLQCEEAFLGQLLDLYMNTAAWSLFPESALTFGFTSKCFCLLSRLGCCISSMLVDKHKRFPYKLFTVLVDPSCAEALASLPDCLKDSLTKTLEATYPNLQHPDVIKILTAYASIQKCDIASVESLHASVRRQVQLRSCQTWQSGLKQISGEWLLQNYRRSGLWRKRKTTTKRTGKVDTSHTPYHPTQP
eukprot:6485926-Amphidinium_carterae.2